MREGLKTNRERLGMTQIQVAKAVGVSVYAYQKWENGTSLPNKDNFNKLKEVLDGTAETKDALEEIL